MTRLGAVLIATIAVVGLATAPASAGDAGKPAAGNRLTPGTATRSVAALDQLARDPVRLSPGQATAGPGARVATACFGEVAPVIKVDSTTVRLSLVVLCDGPIANIAIQAGVFEGNGNLIGDVQFFSLFGVGGVVSFDRPCVNGNLFGAMYAVVGFLSGTPSVIGAFFQGPTVPISC